MKIEFSWERIAGCEQSLTDRAKVAGGWLVRTSDFDLETGETVVACCMVFVPDINHAWET